MSSSSPSGEQDDRKGLQRYQAAWTKILVLLQYSTCTQPNSEGGVQHVCKRLWVMPTEISLEAEYMNSPWCLVSQMDLHPWDSGAHRVVAKPGASLLPENLLKGRSWAQLQSYRDRNCVGRSPAVCVPASSLGDLSGCSSWRPNALEKAGPLEHFREGRDLVRF